MIEKSGRYYTREGHEARIYFVHHDQEYPVHGAVLISKGWMPMGWTIDGKCNANAPFRAMDLVEAQPDRTPGSPMSMRESIAA
jgi:hypothetical protein